MADRPVFLYTAAYSDLADAELDYEALKELHEVGIVGTYDAALIRKDADGKVHVHKREKPTQHGAWGGAAAGALIGLIFPPSIIGTAIVGSVVGGVAGHLWRGMSRGDLKDVGELLDEGQAALVVVGDGLRLLLLECAWRVILWRANRRSATYFHFAISTLYRTESRCPTRTASVRHQIQRSTLAAHRSEIGRELSRCAKVHAC